MSATCPNLEVIDSPRYGPDALEIYKLGRTLFRNSQDLYEAYIMSYHIEDPKVEGLIWEVLREQRKNERNMYEEPTWSATVLPDEEAAKYMLKTPRSSHGSHKVKKRVTFLGEC
mmetsp:Transcript_42037/g.83156  ORF Transcript_42037/g.83156 Transcript_42037/m.83156 type:complete len:114 (-) Transcript_42037:103-444(-)